MAIARFLGVARLAVDGGRANQRRLYPVRILGSSFENDLVDITMECLIGQVCQFFHSNEIVVLFSRPLSQAIILGVFISQYPSTARVQPESRLRWRMALGEAGSNGSCSTFVIRCVCSIC